MTRKDFMKITGAVAVTPVNIVVKNKDEAMHYIPNGMMEFMLQNRSLDIDRVHVTQLLSPPQVVCLSNLFPQSGTDIQDAVRLALGIAFHDSVQENETTFEKDIELHNGSSFTLVGEPDYPHEWRSAKDDLRYEYILDIKVTSAYTIKNAIQESIDLQNVSMDNFPYTIEELKNKYPYTFSWIWQASCYRYLMDFMKDEAPTSLLIDAVNFDAGNFEIMNRIKSKIDYDILNIHPINLPLIPEDILLPDVEDRYWRLWRFNKFLQTTNVATAKRDELMAENMDKYQLRCGKDEIFGGKRCTRYCHLSELCFGVEGSEKCRIS